MSGFVCFGVVKNGETPQKNSRLKEANETWQHSAVRGPGRAEDQHHCFVVQEGQAWVSG